MKTTIKYVADDGREFADEQQCLMYEAREASIAARLNAVFGSMSRRPDDHDFANGSGYLQHDLNAVLAARKVVCEIAIEVIEDHRWFAQTIENGFASHWSWAARLIDECDSKALCAASYRLHCIGSDGREWGQPYYANHQGAAEDVRLNPA
jgi:hypothetical protein